MPQFTISAAARAVGTSRASIQRAIKSGRLSATTNEHGERVIDLSELLRAFGPLKGDADHPSTLANMDGEQRDTPERAPPEQSVIDALREHLADAREQLRESRQEKARLLALLETEQQARRDLETKLLPSPRPTGRVRPWVLLALLLALLAFAGWNFRAVIVPALHL
jgi:hypothetical protein